MKLDKIKLLECVDNLINASILVVGDLALDEMVYGDTERISREAPVLILKHTITKHILGGASNAANNVSTINLGNVSVIGVIGDDYQGNDLINAFKSANINCEYLVKDCTRKTITKTRISGSCFQSITQQIVRIDRQNDDPLSLNTENALIANLEKAIPFHDAVILSDYHIGTLTKRVINKSIELCKKYNKKIIVDAQKDLNKYQYITSMTPNLPDAQKYVGFEIKTQDDLKKAGLTLLSESNSECILITCGADGMAVFEKDGKFTKIPVFNKAEVFDVTGAGDTVTALYSLALASGSEPVYAAIIGNIAASLVVKQFGCATTTVDEIKIMIEQRINKEI